LEQFSFWGDNNISENFWNPTEASQIIRMVEEYIFSDLEIHKLYELWMISNLKINLIDSVSFILDYVKLQ